MEHEKNTEKKFWDKGWVREVREIILYVIIALAIVIPVRIFVAQPFIVSGESMFPTFHNGEYLIVDEISYRFHEPTRGDVIIFRYPKDPKRFFIKRIIGLPGEKLHIDENGVVVSNTEYPNGFKLTEPYAGEMTSLGQKTITVPDDNYFVMGDNRPASSDSRVWGPLPKNLIVGKAWARLLPVKSLDLHPGNLESFGLKTTTGNTYEKTQG